MSYQARINGTQVETGQRATRAWLDLYDTRWGLAVTTRDFFQKNPQRLFGDADGTVEVQFPSEAYSVRQAQGLGDNAIFYFHTGNVTNTQLQQVLEGFGKHRMLALASPAWMRASRAFGVLPDTNLPQRFANANTFLEDSHEATLQHARSGASYGLANYLDLPIDRWGLADNPNDTGWGNGYWDPGATLAAQYARTGDVNLLKEILFPLARHFFTSDMYDPNDTTSFTRGISGARGVAHRGAWTGEYHYSESMWDYYYLTGDPRALERGLMAAQTYANHAQWAVDALQGETLQTTTRSLGQKFNTMMEAWLATGDSDLKAELDTQLADFLTRRYTAEGFVVGNTNVGNTYFAEQAFMVTLGIHDTVYKYYQLTGNALARDFVITVPQRISQYYRASTDPNSTNYMTFYTNIRIDRTQGGGFTVTPIQPNGNSDDFFYDDAYVALATALLRSWSLTSNAASRTQAEELLELVLPRINGNLLDKPHSMIARRMLPGLGLLQQPVATFANAYSHSTQTPAIN